jgi:ring-1,2-phenylacetyl-CoA epoxidase subunit PaaD
VVNAQLEQLRAIAGAVADPEIPVLTIADLGVLRDVAFGTDGIPVITITPTYSGCPAMRVIEAEIRTALSHAGYENVDVRTVLSPAWTTDWLTGEGRAKLHAYGIAPPTRGDPACPQCGSTKTELLSAFGSTSCKALWRCMTCREPFDRFKCH